VYAVRSKLHLIRMSEKAHLLHLYRLYSMPWLDLRYYLLYLFYLRLD
jgi:hypothetical protein